MVLIAFKIMENYASRLQDKTKADLISKKLELELELEEMGEFFVVQQ